MNHHRPRHPKQKVEARALGLEVIDGVTPQVQFVKVVNDELVDLMGSAGSKDLEEPPGGEGSGPQVVLLAGLQGVGKTTAAGKLAMFLAKRRKKVGGLLGAWVWGRCAAGSVGRA
jgi:signal recognition particle subunit SRP54